MSDIQSVNLARAFQSIDRHWHPHVAGHVNDCAVKLAKIQGEFDWHAHEAEDEMFLVVRGRMTMHLREGPLEVGEGEFVIVPRGVEHKPEASEETHILLFEPATTLNTGNIRNERTVEEPPALS